MMTENDIKAIHKRLANIEAILESRTPETLMTAAEVADALKMNRYVFSRRLSYLRSKGLVQVKVNERAFYKSASVQKVIDNSVQE